MKKWAHTRAQALIRPMSALSHKQIWRYARGHVRFTPNSGDMCGALVNVR